MNFRTELHPKPADYKLSLSSKVVTVGSCFSDVIGCQLEKYKVPTLTNPFGTIFNPLSACKLLQICAGADVELADSFVQNNGRWYSYDFHSSFSAETEEELYELLDEVLVKTRRFLKTADLLILTLGTANIFRLNITGETVANCHKVPANNFTRETLLPEEIITAVAETQSLLRELNPNLKLVLTVSPVRHLKDTLELNSVSKSVLRLATHFLSQNLPEVAYFPAYELLLDDLRDYRFYKEDLLHPTSLAENYIWEKFTGAYFEADFQLFTQEWDKILRAKEHKPFHPESPQHQQFIQQMLEKLRTLQDKTDVSEELRYFESQVIILPEPAEEPDTEEEFEEAEIIEEEVIPGYFSEETKTEATEEIATAALTEPAEASISEAGNVMKKKKKPRKKKRKPGIATEAVSLSETGTALPTEIAEPDIILTEPAEELAAILAEPNHLVAHYGETLSETPVVKKQLSKSAKRRESRRKKKALEALENTAISAISEETTAAIPEISEATELTFIPENASVSEEKISEASSLIPEGKKGKGKGKPEKVAGQSKGRRKKPVFSELFAAETPAETDKTEFKEAQSSLNDNKPEEISVPKTADLEKSKPAAAKPKGRGRKPKASPLPVEPDGEPVSETIAVPFVPAANLDEMTAVTEAPVNLQKKRGRTPKPKTTSPKTENTETAANPESKSAKQAGRKPRSTTAKTERKKKALPDS